MPSLRLLSELILELYTSVIIDRESPIKVLLRIEESIYTEMNLKVQINLVAFPTNVCFQMYLFIDNFEVNKSLTKQVLRGTPRCSFLFRGAPQ